jgi:hypothetical protein
MEELKLYENGDTWVVATDSTLDGVLKKSYGTDGGWPEFSEVDGGMVMPAFSDDDGTKHVSMTARAFCEMRGHGAEGYKG